MSKLANLRQAIRNLVHDFGSTQHWMLGMAVNVAGTLLGIGVWFAADGWLAFVGAVWAILHIIAIGKWVVNQ